MCYPCLGWELCLSENISPERQAYSVPPNPVSSHWRSAIRFRRWRMNVSDAVTALVTQNWGDAIQRELSLGLVGQWQSFEACGWTLMDIPQVWGDTWAQRWGVWHSELWRNCFWVLWMGICWGIVAVLFMVLELHNMEGDVLRSHGEKCWWSWCLCWQSHS